MSKEKTGGFTLVELAIVMVVIGLLIGGILKGSEIVEQARITRVIKDVEGYRSAYAIFRDKYNALPGDMLMALGRIPGCDSENGCVNGDGNGRIGMTLDGGNGTSQAEWTNLPRIETTMFWKHLALADLISGVDSAAPVSPASFGTTHPATSFSAGFVAYHMNRHSGITVNTNTLRIQRYLVGTHPTDYDTMPLTPHQARIIDQKLDDGIPRSGFVVGDDINGVPNSGTGCEGNRYFEQLDNQACIQLYLLR